MDISNLPDKEFKVMVLKLFNELGIRMDEYSEKNPNYFKESKIRENIDNSMKSGKQSGNQENSEIFNKESEKCKQAPSRC